MRNLPAVTALELDLDGGWLTVWFNRPESRNALSAELSGDLRRVLEAVRDDRGVRGITLRGRGGVFCAGGDLKAFRRDHQGTEDSGEDPKAGIVAMSKDGAQLFDLVNAMPQVVLAVVEGAAMAGGLGLACCADAMIAETQARFAFTETAIGLTPAQIAPFVVRKVGFATARRLLLTAARFQGQEAQALGLADFVADGPEGLEAVEARIKSQVLACAPGAVADIKALLLALPGMARAEEIDAAAENFAGRLMSEEGREGIAAFMEKRKPVWSVEG